MTIKWTVTAGPDLSASELYELLKLRSAVFCVEQNIVYQDLDSQDLQPTIYHLQGYVDTDPEVAAYLRIMYNGDDSTQVRIGRVVVRDSYRSIGLGRQLMQKSLEVIDELQPTFPRSSMMLHGQAHLQKFYESFGLKVIGDAFIEEDILHYEMVKPLSKV